MKYKDRDVFYQESNFDRMKRKRKQRELVLDFIYAIAAVSVMLLGLAAIITG